MKPDTDRRSHGSGSALRREPQVACWVTVRRVCRQCEAQPRPNETGASGKLGSLRGKYLDWRLRSDEVAKIRRGVHRLRGMFGSKEGKA